MCCRQCTWWVGRFISCCIAIMGPFILQLGLWEPAWAGVTNREEAYWGCIERLGGEAAAGLCTVEYYNLCSGYFWSWAGTGHWGVVFDLPADIGIGSGGFCENTSFWWYWRYTNPGYQSKVDFSIYELDSSLCVLLPPVAVLLNQDPIEGWNMYRGFGGFDATHVAIVMNYPIGSWPPVITDNAARNNQDGCASPPDVWHSAYFGEFAADEECPPAPFGDATGYCNIVMGAAFSCEGSSSTEPSSWGAVKSLFR